MEQETLAYKLGTMTHLSPLPMKARSLALLTIAQFYYPHTMRCGAAREGNEDNDVSTLVRVATWKRSQAVVSYAAAFGKKFAPANPFWEQLLTALPELLNIKLSYPGFVLLERLSHE